MSRKRRRKGNKKKIVKDKKKQKKNVKIADVSHFGRNHQIPDFYFKI